MLARHFLVFVSRFKRAKLLCMSLSLLEVYASISLCSTVEYVAGLMADSETSDGGLNLSAIRAIRMLRPLRAINRIASLRILVSILLEVPLSHYFPLWLCTSTSFLVSAIKLLATREL